MKKLKQIESTKAEIIDALNTLLKKHSYDDITISDISKQSKISRTTIYRHYESKSDIAVELITRDFYTMPEGEVTTRTLLKHRLNSILESNFHLYFAKSYELAKIFFSIKNESFLDTLDITDQKTILFVIGGIDFSIRTWAMAGFKQDVDELVDDIINLVEKVIE